MSFVTTVDVDVFLFLCLENIVTVTNIINKRKIIQIYLTNKTQKN